MRKNMQADTFIDDKAAEAAIGLGTALGLFSLSRFFKNSDNVKERLRRLENGHSTIIQEHKFTVSKLETLNQNLRTLDKYIHDFKHEIANMINEKTLKDGIVDDIYSKMNDIETFITKIKSK